MTKQFLLSSALILALAACTASDTDGTLESASSNASSASEKAAVVDGFRLVEEVKASADETNIPFRKFVLENGLTVVLHQDKSRPQAAKDLIDDDMKIHISPIKLSTSKKTIIINCLGHNLVRGAAGAALANLMCYLNI